MKPAPHAADPPSAALWDDLDPAERELFAGCVAVLSAEAPQIQPSPLNLAVIRARLDAVTASGPEGARVPHSSRWIAWSGWAAAAAIAFLAVGSTHFFHLPHWAQSSIPRGTQAGASGEKGTASNAGGSLANGKMHEAEKSAASSIPGRFLSGVNGSPDAPTRQLVQDMAQLRRDFDRLQQARAARFEPQANLARMVVVEMGDPAQPVPSPGEKRLLTERAADALADGLKAASSEQKDKAAGDAPKTANDKNQGKPATPPSPTAPTPAPAALKLSGDGAQWSNDIVIDQGMVPLSRLTLDDSQQVRHLNFPVDTAETYGLERLDSGFFYDAHNHFVWRPTGEGNGYVGWKDEAFDPEAYRSGGAAFPHPPAVTPATPTAQPPATPAPETAPADPTDDSAPEQTNAFPLARAFTLFDETTGSGSIIVQDLPPSQEGSVYQLWLTDPASQQPISVGLLPDIPNGSDRIFFDFGRPGIAPSGYLITREPAGGAKSPGPTVILKGP